MTPQDRPLGPAKQLAFSLFTVGGLLLCLNLVIEVADEGGLIETRTRDDGVQFLDQPLFERVGDGYQTSSYGRTQCVPSRFAVAKGDTLRVFLLGGSFAMGTPFVHQDHGEEREGGISTTIRAGLAAAGIHHEVLNVAAGAQNSTRVRAIAEEVVGYDQDLLVVATCNNEGVLPPTLVESRLHRYGLYRLVSRGISSMASRKRSLYTPQDPDTDAVRDAFRENLRGIVRSARDAGVPVLLCTLPINLRYRSNEMGHLIPGFDPAVIHQDAPCVAALQDLYGQGDFAGAEEAARDCNTLDAMRLRGLALAGLGRAEEATRLLEQYTELVPRNRCRPSFNQVIREEAARSEGVTLVDLDAHARRHSPQGIPGEELFFDYCHMNQAGYALMAGEILRVMDTIGLLRREGSP